MEGTMARHRERGSHGHHAGGKSPATRNSDTVVTTGEYGEILGTLSTHRISNGTNRLVRRGMAIANSKGRDFWGDLSLRGRIERSRGGAKRRSSGEHKAQSGK